MTTGYPRATAQDRYWLSFAIDLSRRCPRADGAYSVGAVVVGADGNELASGYSREEDPHVHAEGSALGKVDRDDPRLATATLYSTLEPCTQRRSPPPPCTALILATAIPRIVIAWREPGLFVADCQGVERLTAAGLTVVELPEFENAARAVNGHLPGIVRWSSGDAV